jgi:sodium/bile acid cotransporter 7
VRLLVAVVVVKAAVDVAGEVGKLEAGPLLAAGAICLVVHLAGVALGLGGGRLLGLEHAERVAVAFAGSQKTLPVALYLVDGYFADRPLAVVPLVLYHVGQLVADTLIADRFAGLGEPGASATGGRP